MSRITKEAFKFMAELWDNNNKPWFDENRKRYEEHVRKPLKAIAGDLAEPVASILPEFGGKPKISRINNDIRFTPNKPPYKQHMWISFASGKDSCADVFAAIGGSGWAAGCGIGGPKRESLDNWRRNLLEQQVIWRNYCKAVGMGKDLLIYYEGSYKRPLFPEIPEDLYKLVQAKGVWLVQAARVEFDSEPETEFFKGICEVLPVYLFMAIPEPLLLSRLAELGDRITPPDKKVGKIWKALQV